MKAVDNTADTSILHLGTLLLMEFYQRVVILEIHMIGKSHVIYIMCHITVPYIDDDFGENGDMAYSADNGDQDFLSYISYIYYIYYLSFIYYITYITFIT